MYQQLYIVPVKVINNCKRISHNTLDARSLAYFNPRRNVNIKDLLINVVKP